ncbi:phosphatase PAP2/dual specificity phosphatase family protein [Psychrobacter jeotgali]|uniref:phosphatase PAP2/dual specificity phosphatase family protein n=1 Tax=Psychrobacter jeotgali TaxID=179010 RepID=UPI00191B688C|nr:phosphatase PAP2/dual specificity phosphatase family protein [Psychrobacter jeotgali]
MKRIQNLAISLGLFALLYSLTNSYAEKIFFANQTKHFHTSSHLPQVKVYVLATAIDTHIPFIASMIVPYSWSITLFCASFFMVKTPRQLSLLTQRLVLATLLACTVFYLLPARFSFERPFIDNWTQLGYQFLSVTDKPFNQLPSLHVTYALLLGITLWPITRVNNELLTSTYRLLLFGICSLIIASTVFTYQHHLLDIVGGFLLAAVVLIGVKTLRSYLVLKYITIAITGFLLLATTGFFLSLSFSVVIEALFFVFALYWLISFLRVAWFYQTPDQIRNKHCFKKDKQGRLSLMTWVKFAPLLLSYRLLAYLGQRYELRGLNKGNCRLSTDKIPSLYRFIHNLQPYYITDCIYAIATPRLATANIAHYIALTITKSDIKQIIIVDLAAEVPSHFLTLKRAIKNNLDAPPNMSVTLDYLYLPLLDLQSLDEINPQDLIHLFVQLDQLLLTKQIIKGKIMINFHCVMGLSRSVALQVLYLLYCGKLTPANYLLWLSEHYPNAHINDDYLPKSIVEHMAFAKTHKKTL